MNYEGGETPCVGDLVEVVDGFEGELTKGSRHIVDGIDNNHIRVNDFWWLAFRFRLRERAKYELTMHDVWKFINANKDRIAVVGIDSHVASIESAIYCQQDDSLIIKTIPFNNLKVPEKQS